MRGVGVGVGRGKESWSWLGEEVLGEGRRGGVAEQDRIYSFRGGPGRGVAEEGFSIWGAGDGAEAEGR